MPVAVVDIGSNSVRLVIFDAINRAPHVVFNEKASSALGRGVATTGLLPVEGVASALAALSRFRLLCEIAGVSEIRAVATAAARGARNGPEFLARAAAALGAPVDILYGPGEARLAALGVASGVRAPDGVVGDLGGGSLELTEIDAQGPRDGSTFPVGSLALADLSGADLRKAERIARDALGRSPEVARLRGRDFYAVGGVWRALARLDMRMRGYPLDIAHHYVLPARAEFAQNAAQASPEALKSVPAARRPYLAYGALVLDEIVRLGAPERIVVSALGVREGLVYDRLTPEARAQDPLLFVARELNLAHARDPGHADELFDWLGGLTAGAESEDERRLREAACHLADIAWRAHPDLRAEMAFAMILNANLIGIDHCGRVALALIVACRHVASAEDIDHPALTLLSRDQVERARRLGAAMRVAFVLSTGRRGVLPRAPLVLSGGRMGLALPPDLAALGAERLLNRLRPLARHFGSTAEIRTAWAT